MPQPPANDNLDPTTREGEGPLTLVYFADPMCSWCWGFSPVVEQLMGPGGAGAGLAFTVVLGGLRAYNTEPMGEAQRQTISGYWRTVEERSGQPFNHAFWERSQFIYDTEPACRAVVTARETDPEQAPHMLKALQAAFYRDNRDVTDEAVLCEVASEIGLDAAAFGEALASDAMKDATRTDFQVTQQAGVSGFPTLIGGVPERGFALITAGFTDAISVDERVRAIRERM